MHPLLQKENVFLKHDNATALPLNQSDRQFTSSFFFDTFDLFREEAHALSFCANILFLGFFEQFTDETRKKITEFSEHVETFLCSFLANFFLYYVFDKTMKTRGQQLSSMAMEDKFLIFH